MTPPHIHIRPVVPADRPEVHRLALVNQMFQPEELDDVDQMLTGFLDGSRPDDHWLAAVHEASPTQWTSGTTDGDAEEVVLGAAYYAPEPFADRVWNLYFLAVDPAAHGAGVGTALTRHVLEHLHAAGEDVARVLLVETSSTEAYRRARTFYASRGFDEEARIRDYYGPDDDKIVFWRRLL